MHKSSYDAMARMAARFLVPLSGQPRTVVDIGSCSVNGSYRPLLSEPGWRYIGVDMVEGPNVDICLTSAYTFPLDDASADIIVSGQTFEHIEFFWLTWAEIVRVLKPGGVVVLIAPSRGQEHRYPVDCWRFYPDGFRALARLGHLELLHVETAFLPVKPGLLFRLFNHYKRDPWGDTVGVFRKPPA